MTKRKELSGEDTLTLLKEYSRNREIIPSIREMIFTSWMIGWWYLDIARGFWWVLLALFILGLIIYMSKGPSYTYILAKELNQRGYK